MSLSLAASHLAAGSHQGSSSRPSTTWGASSAPDSARHSWISGPPRSTGAAACRAPAHYPLPDLPRRYSEIPPQQRVVLYCACPRQELEGAFRFLSSKGYDNASLMLEGFSDWVNRGYPV